MSAIDDWEGAADFMGLLKGFGRCRCSGPVVCVRCIAAANIAEAQLAQHDRLAQRRAADEELKRRRERDMERARRKREKRNAATRARRAKKGPSK